MKEKENEITDQADCTNHAYHVLWLARRIQHLWITIAVIVRERTQGQRVGGELRFCECVCKCVCLCELQICFCWQWLDFQRQGLDDKKKVTGTPVVHFFSTSWVSHPQPTRLAHRGFIYHCNYPVYLPYMLLVVKRGPIHQIRTIWLGLGFAIYFN